ncbi:pyrimidine reductase family protein [Streptacidiphilus sp. PB12-B1b]|uniref:pyrimidine reductase family protein n=1 Tax=Streptacidiphilus sp. PB12-B1b TaxID=2705012 RepID=UPI0015F803FD|nr:pyrimidine reductase family protein [Streptacidiphilus sp. PB12-B1b]QMU78632.1 pyrimidine reductase family protein [Streptacidiphilus sp. PB12-B1b]
MRRLLPQHPDVTDLTSLEGLAQAYAYPEATGGGTGPDGAPRPGTPWLRGNMVSSLDGAAQLDGLSEGLSSAADKRIFGVLRALADVVVVGAETVRAEGYRPARAREQFAAARAARGVGPAPAVAVVSARLDLDLTLPLFTAPLVPTTVVTCANAPAEALRAVRAAADVIIAGEERVDPALAVAALAERGWTRQLTEGGPTLLGQFVAAGVLDELCLSLAPLLAVGDSPRIAHGAAGPGAAAAAEQMDLVALLEEKGFLFARYTRSVTGAA